jgi:hypothetical protein
MRTVVWTPGLFLTACALSMGVVAQAAPPDAATGDDAGAASDAGATGDATVASDGPSAAEWPGPPSNDGALDDGFNATFPGGDILHYLGICQTLPQPYAYSVLTAPYPDAAGCKAFDPQGHKAAHDCTCDKCFALTQQCDAVQGCREILKCFEDSSCVTNKSICIVAQAAMPGLACNASLTCYLAPNAPCTTVIDKWGNGSVPTGLASDLALCGQSNGCPAK